MPNGMVCFIANSTFWAVFKTNYIIRRVSTVYMYLGVRISHIDCSHGLHHWAHCTKVRAYFSYTTWTEHTAPKLEHISAKQLEQSTLYQSWSICLQNNFNRKKHCTKVRAYFSKQPWQKTHCTKIRGYFTNLNLAHCTTGIIYFIKTTWTEHTVPKVKPISTV